MMPEWLEPMAVTLTQDRFTGPDWVFERKYDGIRLLACKNGSDIKLYSRPRKQVVGKTGVTCDRALQAAPHATPPTDAGKADPARPRTPRCQ
jgi:ATP-dependent DNA ligase